MITPILKPKQAENRVSEPSRTEKKRILTRLVSEQKGLCYLCHKPFDDYFKAPIIEHVIPGKMGGCKDWHWSNLKAACWDCNNRKGSRRDYPNAH